MRRILSVALLLLTAAVVVATGYVVTQKDAVPRAGQTPGYSAAAPATTLPGSDTGSATSSPSSSATSGDPSGDPSTDSSADAAPIATAFLGDNYTSGAGGSDGRSWVALVTKRFGLKASTFAVAGGGYAKQNDDGDTYSSMVDDLVRSDPAVVVVSGGRNDADDDSQAVSDAASALFSALADKLPHAKIVAIAPWWGDSPHPDRLTTVDTAVRNAVTAAGGTYLDLPDPLAGHPGWMADEQNPNNKGYAAIARSVEQALKPYLAATG